METMNLCEIFSPAISHALDMFLFHSQVAASVVCGLAVTDYLRSCGKILASLYFILATSIKTINFPPPKHFFAKSILQASWTNEDILKTNSFLRNPSTKLSIEKQVHEIFLEMKTQRTT